MLCKYLDRYDVFKLAHRCFACKKALFRYQVTKW